MVTTKLNLSMTEPSVRQIYAKQGDTGRVLDIALDQTPEDGTLRILRPDGVEVTSEAVTGGEVESGSSFESLTEADVTELTVGIEPIQDLSHGDPSPSNICPITGHDEVRVTRTGKNLLDPSEWESGLLNTSIGSDINSFVSSSRYAHSGICEVGQAKTVTIKTLDLAKINYCAVVAYVDDKVVWTNAISFTASTTSETWTLASYEKLRINLGAPSGVTADASYVEVQVEQGSTATAYEPYRSNTYTTSLGQTVYGGTLDMVTGQLVVDRGIVDMGSLTWLLNSGLNRKPAFYVRFNDAKTVSSSSVADMTTSCYSVISADNLYSQKDNTGIIALNGQNYLQVRDTRYSTASDYKSGITGQQLVYELATPLTYTLTPQQIKTLVGTNNVWASSGDIVNIKFTYGGLLSELPSDATSIVGKCYCDVEQNGVSSMPFTLNVKKNERAT